MLESNAIAPRTVSLRLRLAPLGCTVPAAFVITFLAAAGSGIVSIPMALMLAATVGAAVVSTLPVILIGRSRGAFFATWALALIGTFIGIFVVIRHFEDNGFILAKEYTRALADAIAATH